MSPQQYHSYTYRFPRWRVFFYSFWNCFNLFGGQLPVESLRPPIPRLESQTWPSFSTAKDVEKFFEQSRDAAGLAFETYCQEADAYRRLISFSMNFWFTAVVAVCLGLFAVAIWLPL